MNKSAIKNFAVRARNKLIEDTTQKAYELGIKSDNDIKEVEIFEGGFKIQDYENSKIYKKYEINQREKLVFKIKEKGFEQIIEEVAYTWFNRFIALRFMEVNEYLPTGVRVLSSVEEGKAEPDIIKEALNIDLDIDKDVVYKLIDANDTEDLYKYLLIKQCNQLGQIMPMVFEEISDYTELLLPDNLLAEGSLIRDLVESIDEEDYKDQVEIIGWLYQYYISEKKDEVFAGLKQNKKITKENIPAATQLFTPKWIVKYMVENSLGRLWLESHPDEELKAKWKYYLEEAEQDPEVQQKLDELKNPNLNPEDIKILDPAMGSGHILVYAFDVLYDIYLKANYSERDIPQLILEKNLYGLDIDDRAGQLAAFALMMKARSKNRRIFRNKIDLNVCAIQESNSITKEAIDYLVSPKDTAIEKTIHIDYVEYLIEVFSDAKEYGSILDVKEIDYDAIYRRLEEIRDGITLDLFELQYKEIILEKVPSLIKQAKIMSAKYDIVSTNPPYLGRKGMNNKLIEIVNKCYPESKKDLFGVFIEKNLSFVKKNGYISMITQHSWMFLSTYTNLRYSIMKKSSVSNMVHLGSRSFEEIGGEVVQTVAFVLRKKRLEKYLGTYIRLVNYNNAREKKLEFFNVRNYYKFQYNEYSNIPEKPIAYWISKKIIQVFKDGEQLSNLGKPREGLHTGDTDTYVKMWTEVDNNKLSFQETSYESIEQHNKKWIPYNKGGVYRKWYGNKEMVISFDKNSREAMSNLKGHVRPSQDLYFQKGMTWSLISSSNFAVRCYEEGMMFDVSSHSFFCDDDMYLFFAGLLNTKVVNKLLQILNPTMNFSSGVIGKIPVLIYKNEQQKHLINQLVMSNIYISKQDWDSFETSWDFKQHPLLNFQVFKNEIEEIKLETTFNIWLDYTNEQFKQLKANEDELNRIFIDIYGLQDELTPEVDDKDITIRKADRDRDIKSFISYAIGCMFGRYSLDEEGLIYAGGQFNINRYKTFIPTKDNVLVIADDDYFEDDIVNRFVEFVKITFGEMTLEENLDYIAETLGKKSNETSRQTIRRYFLKDFYNDHVKTYSKRPIYWLFDSGKENGFKALIYLHRYDTSTVARVRTDYLHKLQKKYEAEVKRLDILIESDVSAREKAAAMKKKDSINKQIIECLAYDQVIAHVANQKVEIDLDDGVAVNYEKFQGVLVPQGEGKKPLKANLLTKI